jgi:hypothetical protein
MTGLHQDTYAYLLILVPGITWVHLKGNELRKRYKPCLLWPCVGRVEADERWKYQNGAIPKPFMGPASTPPRTRFGQSWPVIIGSPAIRITHNGGINFFIELRSEMKARGEVCLLHALRGTFFLTEVFDPCSFPYS